MRNHGFGWPSMMRCNQFPVDNNMCIQSQSGQQTPPKTAPNSSDDWSKVDLGNGVPNRPKANKTGASAQEEDKFYRRLLDLICKSDWGMLTRADYSVCNIDRFFQYSYSYQGGRQ